MEVVNAIPNGAVVPIETADVESTVCEGPGTLGAEVLLPFSFELREETEGKKRKKQRKKSKEREKESV